jgi:phage baseplate assembly protein W
MTDIPHFTLPFRFVTAGSGGLAAEECEQESATELSACCEAIIRTVQGQRTTLPDFGRPQLEFNATPELTVAALTQALLVHEPRVQSLITAAPDPDDIELQAVRVLLTAFDRELGDVP